MVQHRILTKKDMDAAQRVYEICFPNDEEAFINYYFQKRTKPNWILGAFDGERLIGTVHMLPQTARFFGVDKSVCLVVGVATLPEERGKGVAQSMLNAAFEVMRERGFCLTILKAATEELERFYEKFGFKAFAHRDVYDLTLSDFSGVEDIETHKPSAAELLKLYTAYAEGFNGMRVRTLKDMELLLEELTTYESDVLCGGGAYAICYFENGQAHTLELAGDKPLQLLKALSKKYGHIHAAVCANAPLISGKAFTYETFNLYKVLNENTLFTGFSAGVRDRFKQKEAFYSMEMY
ncbi:MAG TPA: GNAT family N-acetyltransferase [Clostridia bacterium]|nr:GNAT family N-acetyltransferase [Clostridia bacterium]